MNKLEAYNNVIMANNILKDKGLVASQKFMDSLGACKITELGVMMAYIKTHGFEKVRQEMILAN